MESIRTASERSQPPQRKLLKILGVSFGVAITIGGALGVGILRMPGIVAANLKDPWLIVAAWIFGALYAFIGVNSIAELATALPKAGGGYVYIRRAYGDFFGFAGGMNDFVLTCCGAAYISIVLGEYIAALVPALAGRENAIGIAALLVLFFINWIGLRAGDFTQKLTSFLKVAAFFALVIACFIFGGQSSPAPPAKNSGFASLFAMLAVLGVAMQSVNETYAGCSSAVYFSEENEDAARSLPRAMFLGVLLLAAIYVSVNVALLYVLPVSEIGRSNLAVAHAAEVMFGPAGGKIITALAILSVIGVLNAIVLYMPRTVFAMSRDGFLPAIGARVNAGGTPVVALLATVSLIIALVATGSFETLLAIAAFLSIAGEFVVYLALFVLRWREPDLRRPFRALGYPILPAIVLLTALALLVVYAIGNPARTLYSIGILVLFYPAFLLGKRSASNEHSCSRSESD